MDAVKNTSRVGGLSELATARISSPVSPGIEMSKMAISGSKFRIASRQLVPSLQDATTLKPFSGPSKFVKPSRTTGWRSAITTLIHCIGDPQYNLLKYHALTHVSSHPLRTIYSF